MPLPKQFLRYRPTNFGAVVKFQHRYFEIDLSWKRDQLIGQRRGVDRPWIPLTDRRWKVDFGLGIEAIRMRLVLHLDGSFGRLELEIAARDPEQQRRQRATIG